MIYFRNEYIRRVFRAADTSGGQHPAGRCAYSAHWYALMLISQLTYYYFSVFLLSL